MAVSKEVAVKRLQMKSVQGGFQHPDGAFLVRPSESNPNDLSLSVRYVLFVYSSCGYYAYRVAANLENLQYLGISLNTENSGNSVQPQRKVVTNKVFLVRHSNIDSVKQLLTG